MNERQDIQRKTERERDGSPTTSGEVQRTRAYVSCSCFEEEEEGGEKKKKKKPTHLIQTVWAKERGKSWSSSVQNEWKKKKSGVGELEEQCKKKTGRWRERA